jgi:hypothetical protein
MNDCSGTAPVTQDDTSLPFTPELILRAQHGDAAPGWKAAEGEHRLMVAILEDAVGCYQQYATATTQRGRRRFLEAAEWIFADDAMWIFSYDSICTLWGVSATKLRTALIQWRDRQLAARGPASRSFRRIRLRTPHRHNHMAPRSARRAA